MTGRGLCPRFRPRLRRGCAVRRHRPARGAFEALDGASVGREVGGADNEAQAAAGTDNTHDTNPHFIERAVSGDLPPGPLIRADPSQSANHPPWRQRLTRGFVPEAPPDAMRMVGRMHDSAPAGGMASGEGGDGLLLSRKIKLQ